MNANRELRQNVFMTVHDFLVDNYDCDCPRIDPEGSHTAEAQKLTQLILGAVDAQEIWEDGYSSGAGDNYSSTPVGEIDSSLCDERTPNPYEGAGRVPRERPRNQIHITHMSPPAPQQVPVLLPCPRCGLR